MRERHSNSFIRILLITAPLWIRAAAGQEHLAGDFTDVGEAQQSFFTWQLILALLAGCLALYWLWKITIRFLENRSTTIEWVKVRIGWPTAMLISGWMVLPFVLQKGSQGWAFDVMVWVYGIINLPAVALAGVVLRLLYTIYDLPDWVGILVGSIAIWVGNYLMVRVAEWRAWINVPVALNLGSDPSETPAA